MRNIKDMIRASIILLLILISKAVFAIEIPDGFSLLKDRKPIHSTLGFSFAPPSGHGWYEKFGATEIIFFKNTNPTNLSFYTGVVEGKMQTVLADNNDLLKFVKAKKDQWGSDTGRYRNITSKFLVAENVGLFCIGYELSAEDHKAKNLGANKFMILRTKGVFCLHPKNKRHAVDIYYSARHIPAFDYISLMNEGETFIKSLHFISI